MRNADWGTWQCRIAGAPRGHCRWGAFRLRNAGAARGYPALWNMEARAWMRTAETCQLRDSGEANNVRLCSLVFAYVRLIGEKLLRARHAHWGMQNARN